MDKVYIIYEIPYEGAFYEVCENYKVAEIFLRDFYNNHNDSRLVKLILEGIELKNICKQYEKIKVKTIVTEVEIIKKEEL